MTQDSDINCGYSIKELLQPSKLKMRVRFSLPAPNYVDCYRN
jgi:hypothetical protein